MQQIGGKAINTYYPPLQLEKYENYCLDPNLEKFHNLKKRYNNEMLIQKGDKPAVIMHSPQYKTRFNFNRDLPLNLACIKRLAQKNKTNPTVPAALSQSTIYKELTQLSTENPTLLVQLSLKKFNWKKTSKPVLEPFIETFAPEENFGSDEEEFYGWKMRERSGGQRATRASLEGVKAS